MTVENFEEAKKRQRRESEGLERQQQTLASGSDGTHIPEMDLPERLARLEGGYRLFVLVISVILAGIAFLGVQSVRLDTKIDTKSDNLNNKISTLSDKVDALPGKINSDIQNLTRTLSDAITASKQTPPQVIIMQAPTPTNQSNQVKPK